jgi:hypothetical protein
MGWETVRCSEISRTGPAAGDISVRAGAETASVGGSGFSLASTVQGTRAALRGEERSPDEGWSGCDRYLMGQDSAKAVRRERNVARTFGVWHLEQSGVVDGPAEGSIEVVVASGAGSFDSAGHSFGTRSRPGAVQRAGGRSGRAGQNRWPQRTDAGWLLEQDDGSLPGFDQTLGLAAGEALNDAAIGQSYVPPTSTNSHHDLSG